MAPTPPKPVNVAAAAAAESALPGAGVGPRRPAPSATVQISSDKLFAGAIEVQIEHHGALYRLKKTSLGKLILTK